jgi:hypothetical protein
LARLECDLLSPITELILKVLKIATLGSQAPSERDERFLRMAMSSAW